MGLKAILLPDLGEGVTEGEIIKIKVLEGDSICMDQALVEIMTDKASMEVPSSIKGKIKKIEVKEGDIVSVGARLFTVEVKDGVTSKKSELEHKETSKNSVSSPPQKEKKDFHPETSPTNLELATPATRKLAMELELSLKNIQGTGLKGEIKREDLIQYIKSNLQNRTQASLPSVKPAPFPSNLKESKREPLRGIKRLMFDSMTLSKATIPHFTIGDRACVTHLVKLKKEMHPKLEKLGLKTSWLAFFIKALVPVLKEFPIFNSVYDSRTKEIVYGHELNIGFAVDSPQGLLVPVLKQAQDKSLLDIIKEIQQLAEATRSGSIERINLTGASITVSNLGSLGGLYGTPIINSPEMAIMGIYSLFHQVAKNSDGEWEEKPYINFSITCDHRFIDGATAARCLKKFVQIVEEPSLLLLD